jgi:hypothetical protein
VHTVHSVALRWQIGRVDAERLTSDLVLTYLALGRLLRIEPILRRRNSRGPP